MSTKPSNEPNVNLSNPPAPLVTTGEAVNYRDSWRIFRMVTEFVEGYQFLGGLKKEVTILGSARLHSNDKYYKVAEELGHLLGKNDFTTITGGGPGIMEAANKGAFESGGESVGLNIQLPREQRVNQYVKKSIGFYYFFTRKVMLTSPANALVCFPGGFGTLDEFFEVADYMELGQMEKCPIILVGRAFWQPVIDFLCNQSANVAHSISKEDTKQWHIVETAKEAYEIIEQTEDRVNSCNLLLSPHCQGDLNWRIFRIMAELVDGFEFLTKVKRDVTILGTKSILPGTSYYDAAYEVGKILAENQYTIITGGGPGIMEAANKGAFEKGGESLGVNMRVEKGERYNNFITKSIGFFFPFVRKLIITAPSEAFVFFPGGLGTMHQLFELLTLMETKKMAPVPLLLYGEEFWRPLLNVIHNLFHEFKTISQIDEDYLKIVNRPEEVLGHLK